MAREIEGADRFEVSRVLARAFDAIGKDFLTFGAIAVLLYAAPNFLWQWLFASRVVMPAVAQSSAGVMATYLGSTLLMTVVAMVLKAVLLAAVTRGMVERAGGGRASIGACLTTAVVSLLPVTALALMCFIGILGASMLLVVPGLMLWVAWAVVVPVFVAEKPGLLESFGRSLQLTRGVRWPIFGIFVAVAVANWVIAAVVGVALALSMATLQLPGLFVGLGSVVAALLALVGTAITASIYIDLREAKEDAPPAELETIFA